jgi:hypothetical protein
MRTDFSQGQEPCALGRRYPKLSRDERAEMLREIKEMLDRGELRPVRKNPARDPLSLGRDNEDNQL